MASSSSTGLEVRAAAPCGGASDGAPVRAGWFAYLRDSLAHPLPAVVAVILAVAAGRLIFLFIVSSGAVDGGSYLAHWHQERGAPLQVLDVLDRPPLGPGYLLWPFTLAFDGVLAVGVFSAIACAFPPLTAYLLFQAAASKRMAAWSASGVGVGDPMILEAFFGGVMPYFAGSFVLLAMWGVLRLRDGLALLPLAAISAGIALTLYTSLSMTAVGGAVLASWTAMILPRRAYLPVGIAASIGLAAAAPVALTLLAYRPGETFHFEGVAFLQFGPRGWMMLGVLMAALVIYHAIRLSAPIPVRALAILSAPIALSGSLLSGDESVSNFTNRSGYMFAICFALPAAWCLARQIPRLYHGRIAIAILGLLIGMLIITMPLTEREFFTFTPDEQAAADYILSKDPAGVVAPNRVIAHWVSALTENAIPVYWSPGYIPSTSEQIEIQQISWCAYGWTDCEGPPEGIDYILVSNERLLDLSLPYRTPTNSYMEIEAEWLLKVADFGSASVYRVRS